MATLQPQREQSRDQKNPSVSVTLSGILPNESKVQNFFNFFFNFTAESDFGLIDLLGFLTVKSEM